MSIRRPEAPSVPSPAPPSRKVIGGLVLLYVAWGSTYVAFKISFEALPPLLSTGARFALAGIIVLVIARRRGARVADLTWPQVRSALILGFLMVGLGTGLVVIAIKHLTTGTAALVLASVPMWVAIGDRVGFGSRLSRRTTTGLLVGFVGILALGGPVGGRSIGLIWVMLVLLGAMAWAFGALASRVMPLVEDRMVATGLQMTVGGLMVAAAGVGGGDLRRLHPGAVSASSMVAWLYLLFISALLGFNLYMWLLRVATPTLVSTASYVEPVLALGFGWALLGEGLTMRSAVAATIIVAGAALIVTAPSPSVPGGSPVTPAQEG